MLLLTTQTNNTCFWCIFILMLGAFLIGFFAKNIKLPSKKTNTTKKSKGDNKEERQRIKPLGIIKTMERSGNEVKDTDK